MNQVYLDQFTHHEKVKFLVQKKTNNNFINVDIDIK